MTFLQQIRINILLPLRDNEGNEISELNFIRVNRKFRKDFGGYTRIIPPSQGEWRSSDGQVYGDFNIGYDIIVKEKAFATKIRPDLGNLIKNLEKEFKQEKIACYYHNVMSNL